MDGKVMLLSAMLVCSIVCVIGCARKKMSQAGSAISGRRLVLSLVINCNNYKPIGDVFFSLDQLLADADQKDNIEYRGHF